MQRKNQNSTPQNHCPIQSFLLPNKDIHILEHIL